nr:calcium/calmodulin-regulated receptor-like kinase 1 [Ipomoea batatas]
MVLELAGEGAMPPQLPAPTSRHLEIAHHLVRRGSLLRRMLSMNTTHLDWSALTAKRIAKTKSTMANDRTARDRLTASPSRSTVVKTSSLTLCGSNSVAGRGVYGHVYKAQMPTGEAIVVKVLGTYSKQGEKEFHTKVLASCYLEGAWTTPYSPAQPNQRVESAFCLLILCLQFSNLVHEQIHEEYEHSAR